MRELEVDRMKKEKQNSELKEECDEKMKIMDRTLDCHEEYSRRACLLVWRKMAKKNAEEFVTEMQEEISINGIDRSHRPINIKTCQLKCLEYNF